MKIYQRFIKRLLDVCLSIIALICLSPLMVIIAIIIRWKLGSPILFKQERPGKNENIFTLYKFRTMIERFDDEGNLLEDRLRITKLGIFLRQTSLDELPELLNILKGEMSIVGPRPLLISYLPYYTDEEKHRHDVRPGLTGLAQINGRNNLNWDERLEKDIEYINNITFIGDLKIIISTVLKVLNGDDVAVDTESVEGNLADIRKELSV